MAALPQVQEQFKYACPFYVYSGAWLCYFYVRKGKIVWGICQGVQLNNESGLLQHNGRKQVAHIDVNDHALFDSEALAHIIQEAAFLNEQQAKQRQNKAKKKPNPWYLTTYIATRNIPY